jgi:hypothetical protein
MNNDLITMYNILSEDVSKFMTVLNAYLLDKVQEKTSLHKALNEFFMLFCWMTEHTNECAGHAMQYLQIWRVDIHSHCNSHTTISMNRRTVLAMNSFRCIKRDLFWKNTNERSVLCNLKQ